MNSVTKYIKGSFCSSCLLFILWTGVQADQRVLAALVSTYLPGVDSVVREHDIELSLITLHWFVTIFASVLHMKILLRVWDMFFLDGSIVLFQVTLAMLKIKGELNFLLSWFTYLFFVLWTWLI